MAGIPGAAAQPFTTTPGAGQGAPDGPLRPLILVAGVWTVLCWVVILTGLNSPRFALGLLGLLPIGIVWRARNRRRRRRRGSVIVEGLGVMGRDMKNTVDHASQWVTRTSLPIGHPDADPTSPKRLFGPWFAVRLLSGAGWLLLCVTWLPIRDAVAELRRRTT